jgi:DNA-binding IclR family transcriptional regulator
MSKGARKSYSAPALEKGLDVLELLAASRVPLSTMAIAEALDRSRSEIFRMLSVLEDRGFIAHASAEEGFVLTTRLLELAMQSPPSRQLLEVALPVMERVAEASGQSCHIAVASGAEMVVIARVESPGDVGFAVRIGYRRSLVESTSGRVILAHQSEAGLEALLMRVREEVEFDEPVLMRDLKRIQRDGYRRAKSSFVNGIIDIGCPVFDGVASGAIAALTTPCVERRSELPLLSDVIELLRAGALEITSTLRARAGVHASRSR